MQLPGRMSSIQQRWIAIANQVWQQRNRLVPATLRGSRMDLEATVGELHIRIGAAEVTRSLTGDVKLLGMNCL